MSLADKIGIGGFALAVLDFGWHLLSVVLGVSSQLYPPPSIVIMSEEYMYGGNIIRVFSDVTIEGRGAKDEQGLIRDVAVKINVGNLAFDERWFSFGRFNLAGGDFDKPAREVTDSAHPVAISGGGVFNSGTYFAPFHRSCDSPSTKQCDMNANYVTLPIFLKALEGSRSARLDFVARRLDRRSETTASCFVKFNQAQFDFFKQHFWVRAYCE